MSFKKKIVEIAHKEIARWQSMTELSQNASQILVNYWKSVGKNYTIDQMRSPSFQQSRPWSSAFISYLFYKAGAKKQFPYSASHFGYFSVAKRDRDNKNAPLRGFRIHEYAPKVGDIVVYSREAGKGYDTNSFFGSHGEVVLQVGKGFIKTVGGNVSNKVKLSTFNTNAKGLLEGNRVSFFMVIQNNIR